MSTALHMGASRSAVSAVSLALGVIVLSALVLLAADPGMHARMAQAHLPGQGTHDSRGGTAARAANAVPADPRLAEIEQRFGQAVVMLHARRYEEALVALERVITLSPRLPEAYVNSGYALLGLEQYENARDFFLAATELDPYQGNAYWGSRSRWRRSRIWTARWERCVPTSISLRRTIPTCARPARRCGSGIRGVPAVPCRSTRNSGSKSAPASGKRAICPTAMRRPSRS